MVVNTTELKDTGGNLSFFFAIEMEEKAFVDLSFSYLKDVDILLLLLFCKEHGGGKESYPLLKMAFEEIAFEKMSSSFMLQKPWERSLTTFRCQSWSLLSTPLPALKETEG